MKTLLKFTCILTIAISSHLYTFGQQQFGVKISGGVSKINNTGGPSNASFSNPFVPSGQAGLFCNFSLSEKSSLGAELLFSQIEGKEKWEVDFLDNEGKNIGHATALTYRHISNLSLPVYYGFKMNKLTINAGFQVSYVLGSSGGEKNDAIINEEHVEQYNYDRKVDDINIENIDYGPKAGIIYHLNNRLSVEGTYYYGLNNIQKGEVPSWELKIQQMTVGLRYSFWSKQVN